MKIANMLRHESERRAYTRGDEYCHQNCCMVMASNKLSEMLPNASWLWFLPFTGSTPAPHLKSTLLDETNAKKL